MDQSPSHEAVRCAIGYDSKEAVAYHVLLHSILSLTSAPVTIYPIKLEQLTAVFSRPRDPRQSTEFSFSRFLAPWMCDYRGWILFMDCDMLALADLSELWSLRDNRFAVMVVKHDYTPRSGVKFLGNMQSPYPKKNWSSLMLMNCSLCRKLTPEYVSKASGLELHQFKWLHDESLIGEIPVSWNHLVGEYAVNPAAKIAHFTLGGPWWSEFRDCEYAAEWERVRDGMASSRR